MQPFVQPLRRDIGNANLQKSDGDSLLVQLEMQLIHEHAADLAPPKLRNYVQRKNMRTYWTLDPRQNKSENSTGPLCNSCYALGVAQLGKELRTGERDILRKTDPVNFMQLAKVCFSIRANP